MPDGSKFTCMCGHFLISGWCLHNPDTPPGMRTEAVLPQPEPVRYVAPQPVNREIPAAVSRMCDWLDGINDSAARTEFRKAREAAARSARSTPPGSP